MGVSRSHYLVSSEKAAILVVGCLLAMPDSGANHPGSHPSFRNEFSYGAFDYYRGICAFERDIQIERVHLCRSFGVGDCSHKRMGRYGRYSLFTPRRFTGPIDYFLQSTCEFIVDLNQ